MLAPIYLKHPQLKYEEDLLFSDQLNDKEKEVVRLLCMEYTAAEIAPLEWVYNKPFYIIVNLAMGGHFTGPISDDLNETQLDVDYIRHYSIDGVGTFERH